MKRNAIRPFIIALFSTAIFGIFMLSCGQRNTNKNLDTPTSGKIKVGIDDSYKLMMQAQFNLFTNFYKNAPFDTIYDPETNIVIFS